MVVFMEARGLVGWKLSGRDSREKAPREHEIV